MEDLKITIIDVGSGDSILLESIDTVRDKIKYALIDSNDSANLKPAYIFLKKYFETKRIDIDKNRPIFDFVAMSHAHADHAEGLKYIINKFGTKNFYFSSTSILKSWASLIRYARISKNVNNVEKLDNQSNLLHLGKAKIKILSPDPNDQDKSNENNNSLVMRIEINSRQNKYCILSGDAEERVWNTISTKVLPSEVVFFKIPHHGAKRASMKNNKILWDHLIDITETELGISCHIKPHSHPDSQLIKSLETSGATIKRTDESYHLIYYFDRYDTAIRCTQ